MMDLQQTNQWQLYDTELHLVYPWYTWPALDEISQWDMKGKIVFEYGLGASTLWWSKKSAWVVGVDHDKNWWQIIQGAKLRNVSLRYYDDKEKYVNIIGQYNIKFDVVVVDGEYWRDECIFAALPRIKPGGRLIVDNWLQPSVWMADEKTQNRLIGLEKQIYKQPNHPDWQTAIFKII